MVVAVVDTSLILGWPGAGTGGMYSHKVIYMPYKQFPKEIRVFFFFLKGNNINSFSHNVVSVFLLHMRYCGLTQSDHCFHTTTGEV